MRTCEELNTKYDLSCNWLRYRAIIDAIPRQWKHCIELWSDSNADCTQFDKISKVEKVSTWLYRDLLPLMRWWINVQNIGRASMNNFNEVLFLRVSEKFMGELNSKCISLLSVHLSYVDLY